MRISDFDYLLPKDFIAQQPASPRDHSRLFVYNTKTDKIIFDYFYNLDKYLPKKSFLVLNDTRVIPARVWLTRLHQGFGGQGKILALLLLNEQEKDGTIKTLVDRKVSIGDRLFIDKDHFFTVVDQKEKIFFLKFTFSVKYLLTKLQQVGKTPIPLYLRKTPLSERTLRQKYQTVFASYETAKEKSVAAPTASLHFTKRVFKKLDKKGIKQYKVTLNVGLGTFAPIIEENLKNKKLHQEYFQIRKQTLQCIKTLKLAGKSLVAVGTTVVRTLESRANNKKDKTDLFIFPPYDFKMVDILLTNFHPPKSSLMMLVEAFLQHKKSKRSLVELYQIAINNHFRFYSFGDAMLIL